MQLKRFFLFTLMTASTSYALAQFDNSGISAGFFDSSENQNLNFSTFHLPPLAVLLENAKSTPQILSLAKAEEIAKAEVAKQKKHIFSYINGHASYSYGRADLWGNNSSSLNQTIYQFQGSEQSYWNVGVSLHVPLEDILDLGSAVKRKRLERERAQIEKDMAYDQLKLQLTSLYVKINNNIIALKTASENAAIYQGAGQLAQEQFHQGELSIEAFAKTKEYENGAVAAYQSLQTIIITDILTLEILTHTPIITNTTTEITLDSEVQKSAKQIARENKAVEKRIEQQAKDDLKKEEALEKAEKEAQKEAEKAAKKAAKQK